jgi:hypothetical protein
MYIIIKKEEQEASIEPLERTGCQMQNRFFVEYRLDLTEIAREEFQSWASMRMRIRFLRPGSLVDYGEIDQAQAAERPVAA